MATAYSYERVSSTQQVEGRGLDRQGDAARRWAKQHGISLDTALELSDRGRSASKGHHLTKGALGRFLALAQQGQLGDGPILLVEAVDRLSRQEPLDAIETILTGLVGSGVRIVTLEDGAEYSRETLRTDPTKLLVLVVKMQAAYEYSARLSMRIRDAWASARQKLNAQVMARPRLFCPAWCDWSEDVGYVINEDKAAIVRKCFELLRHQGAASTARDLNAAGYRTPAGNAWTVANVRNLAINTDGVFGAIRLNSKRHHGPSAQEQVIEGMLPVVLDKAEVLAVRELMKRRANTTEHTGPTGTMRWVGQGLTYCVCGYRMGLMTSGGAVERHKYLVCRRKASDRAGCQRGNVPVPIATAHLLRRLEPDQLERLVAAAAQGSAVVDHQAVVNRWRKEINKYQRQLVNTSTALKEAAKAGVTVLELFDAQAEVQADLQRAEQQLALAQQELERVGAAVLPVEPVRQFREAFAVGRDTVEQRRAVNRGLHELGLRIEVDGDAMGMGLLLPGGELEWQTIRPLDRRLLWAGRTLAEADGILQEG